MAWLEEHLGLVKVSGGSAFCAMLVTLELGQMPATYVLLAAAVLLAGLWVYLDEF